MTVLFIYFWIIGGSTFLKSSTLNSVISRGQGHIWIPGSSKSLTSSILNSIISNRIYSSVFYPFIFESLKVLKYSKIKIPSEIRYFDKYFWIYRDFKIL